MFERYRRYIATLGGLTLVLSLFVLAAQAQTVRQPESTQVNQLGNTARYASRLTGEALVCSPGSDRDDEIYKCRAAPKLRFIDHVVRVFFRFVRDPIALLTLGLFVIGGVQVEIGRRTALRQLRAYVFLDHTSLHDGSTANPPWPQQQVGTPAIVSVVKNFGQTPAYDVLHWSVVDVKRATEEYLLIPQAPLSNTSAAILPPTSTIPRVRTFHRLLTPHEIAEIETGVSAIFYYGRIEFRDAFKRKRVMNYRLKYTGAWPPPPNASMTYCDGGNHAN
jgi:hypothetical protein